MRTADGGQTRSVGVASGQWPSRTREPYRSQRCPGNPAVARSACSEVPRGSLGEQKIIHRERRQEEASGSSTLRCYAGGNRASRGQVGRRTSEKVDKRWPLLSRAAKALPTLVIYRSKGLKRKHLRIFGTLKPFSGAVFSTYEYNVTKPGAADRPMSAGTVGPRLPDRGAVDGLDVDELVDSLPR